MILKFSYFIKEKLYDHFHYNDKILKWNFGGYTDIHVEFLQKTGGANGRNFI